MHSHSPVHWTGRIEAAIVLKERSFFFPKGVAMNDVSRSFRGNSNAARDIAHHLHPYTNFKKHEENGQIGRAHV